MKSKRMIWWIVIEILILLIVFSAIDEMTWPSESTDVAVREAVNKKQLEPICMVEVHSAIRSASFMRFALAKTIGVTSQYSTNNEPGRPPEDFLRSVLDFGSDFLGASARLAVLEGRRPGDSTGQSQVLERVFLV